MTISSETNKSGPYPGNGVTTIFDYDFKIVDENHLSVIKRNIDGSETKLTIDVHYTVSGVGNPAGGNIVALVPPAVGEYVTNLLDVPFTQETDLENQGAYNAETVEAALDLSVQRDLQLKEELGRAIKVPVSEGGEGGELAAELAADIIRLATSADNIDTVASSIGNVNSVAEHTSEVDIVAANIEKLIEVSGSVLSLSQESYTADGVSPSFTLPATPLAAQDVLVWHERVRLVPYTQYTVAGDLLTVTALPAVDDVVDVLVISAVSAEDVQAMVDQAEGWAGVAEDAASEVVDAVSQARRYTTQEWLLGLAGGTLPDRIETSGYYNPYDLGGAVWRKVGSMPSHPGRMLFVPSGGGAGSWYVIASTFLTPQMLGAKADSVNPMNYRSKSTYIAARNAVNGGLGPTNLYQYLQDCFTIEKVLRLPIRIAGHFWMQGRAQYYIGPAGDTYIQYPGVTLENHPDFGLKSASIAMHDWQSCVCPEGATFLSDGTLNPAWNPDRQAHMMTFGGFSLHGSMTAGKVGYGIIISQCRTPTIKPIRAGGFVDGTPIKLHAFQRGGMFQPLLESIFAGHSSQALANSPTEDEVLMWSNRAAIWVYTSDKARGKINDGIVRRVYAINCLETVVKTTPFEVVDDYDVYGAGNWAVDDAFSMAKYVRDFREGTLVQLTETTYKLTYTTKLASDNFAPHDGMRYLLRVWNDVTQDWTHRIVTAHDVDNDIITISAALPFVPAPGFAFGIKLTTNLIDNANDARNFPRFACVHSDEIFVFRKMNAEGHEVDLVLHPKVKRLFVPEMRAKVDNSIDFRMIDGSLKIIVPVNYTSADMVFYGGYKGAGSYHMMSGIVNYAEGAYGANGTLPVGATINAVFSSTSAVKSDARGLYVEAGDAVRWEASDTDGRIGMALPKVRITTGTVHLEPMLVAGPLNTRYYNGDVVPVMAFGVAFANVAGNVPVSRTARLGPGANGKWRVRAGGEDLAYTPLVALADADGSGSASGTVRMPVLVK